MFARSKATCTEYYIIYSLKYKIFYFFLFALMISISITKCQMSVAIVIADSLHFTIFQTDEEKISVLQNCIDSKLFCNKKFFY